MKNKIQFLLLLFAFLAAACNKNDTVEFYLSDHEKAATIYIDENTDSLILWAVEDFVNDVALISGVRPEIKISDAFQEGNNIYIGKFDDPLLNSVGSTEIDSLAGAWEKFHITMYQGNLIISGSDLRGTVYGVFELAERLGISPWKWWADVVPPKQEVLLLEIPEGGITQEPSMQFRGIFLNDEDWGLQPWAAKTFEPETNDIGPKTYEKIFQLLLSLKANTIWPAMHPSTQAFFSIPGNKEMAEKYHIYVGTSHAEPMLRNNVDEWDKKAYGDFNYASNSKTVKAYWQERISETKEGNNIITVGMRGIHDSGMEGDFTADEKVNLLEKIISEQREMLSETIDKPLEEIPQVLTLYKEVLYIYNNGLNVPDDVTLMWTDDNYGYIRRLSNEEEQQRAGGSGVYYHLSYWGRPHDYLWLSTTQPGLIWYEMTRAYENGAQKIWIANVGDIKPAELTMEFFLDLAWDVNSINNENIGQYITEWAAREFGEEVAEDISTLMSEYFRLAFLRKPEYMGWNGVEPKTAVKASGFNSKTNGNEVLRRIADYEALYNSAEVLKENIHPDKQNAWFQLVEYPVKGAALMNYKFLYAQLAGETDDLQKKEEYAGLAKNSFDQIKDLTNYYNEEMSSGKWNHMMSMNPRNLVVFDLPENLERKLEDSLSLKTDNQVIFIQAGDYSNAKASDKFKWITIDELGYSNRAVTLSPFVNSYFEKEEMPYLEYEFETGQRDSVKIIVRVLPTHSNNFDHELGIQLDENEIQYFKVNTKGRSEDWKQNVLRNSVSVEFKSVIETKGFHAIRLYVNQTGIVIDQLVVDFNTQRNFYEIPVK